MRLTLGCLLVLPVIATHALHAHAHRPPRSLRWSNIVHAPDSANPIYLVDHQTIPNYQWHPQDYQSNPSYYQNNIPDYPNSLQDYQTNLLDYHNYQSLADQTNSPDYQTPAYQNKLPDYQSSLDYQKMLSDYQHHLPDYQNSAYHNPGDYQASLANQKTLSDYPSPHPDYSTSGNQNSHPDYQDYPTDYQRGVSAHQTSSPSHWAGTLSDLRTPPRTPTAPGNQVLRGSSLAPPRHTRSRPWGKAPPMKRYLGIELPDYIATSYSSVKTDNAHYLTKLHQLKQRMRNAGK